MIVEKGAYNIITDCTPKQRIRIMEDLALDNPKYVSAKKHTSYSRISIPAYLEYYSKVDDTLVVPRGYEIPFKYRVALDSRFVGEDVDYPKLRVKLRKTQRDAFTEYLKRIRNENNGDAVVVLPTGKGKSVLGLYAAYHLRKKTLIVVHKDDLVDGWKKDARMVLGLRPKQVGIIKARTFRIGEQITIATIQTLSRLTPEALQELRETFSFVIVDECHHVPARTFDLVATFPAFYKMGLTATDKRNDGLGEVINFHMGTVVFRFTEDGEDDEDILSAGDVHIRLRASNVEYTPKPVYTLPNSKTPIEYFYYDYVRYYIEELLPDELNYFLRRRIIFRKPLDYNKVMKAIWSSDSYNSMVVSDILGEYRQSKSCLALCIEKEHCEVLYNELIEAGVPENRIQLYYGDSTDSKPLMKRRAEKREALITIATYAIAKEGTNVKAWERIFLAMTVNNEIDVIQAIGRGRRRCEGKSNLIVYDYYHPFVVGADKHIHTRMGVYSRLNFNIIGRVQKVEKSNHGMFTRGWRRSS